MKQIVKFNSINEHPNILNLNHNVENILIRRVISNKTDVQYQCMQAMSHVQNEKQFNINKYETRLAMRNFSVLMRSTLLHFRV